MEIGERSKKYVEYHMFNTFHPIYETNTQVHGLWHESNGEIRYESILEEESDGTQISYLFPIFNPDSDEFDNYSHF